MIVWFSGTGNSRAVAEHLGTAIGTAVLPLTHTAGRALTLSADEPLGIVAPVYGWRLPSVVAFLLRTLLVHGAASGEGIPQPYVFVVLTCGDDIGRTDREVRRCLSAARLPLHSIWSVRMPNTYVSLPGFDVDSEAVASQKLRDARRREADIARAVLQRREGIVDVVPGAFPRLKTHLLGRFFHRFLVTDRRFHTTASCTSCGRCLMVCPVRNLRRDEQRRPLWQGKCTACLACYHHCPQRAIRYGRFTQHKGQYVYRET